MYYIVPIFFSLVLTHNVHELPRCGYETCPPSKPGMINVHIIPHTHDDVGWLKTYDQYYYGSSGYLGIAGVQYILDSVLHELQEDPKRRFIYVETAYFWRWLVFLDDKRRQQVAKLVQSGQLEFIGGGWCMNDEAATHYQDIIDQMTVGMRTLRALFKDCGVPRTVWQIDTFGHSREQASLFSQMGFDGLFLGRIDYAEKEERLERRSMEFVWKSSANLKGPGSSIFTGVLFNTYSPPPGFCFDILCSDEPIIDDPRVPDYNVPRRILEFYYFVIYQASYYATNNIAITMGNDFNYQQAATWYKNLDKLIKYTNQYKDGGFGTLNAFYSTPNCYLKSLQDANITWTTKDDDFLPYASDPHSYWSGYFTSRPNLKANVRLSNNILQVCKQLDAVTAGSRSRTTNSVTVDFLRKAQGILQHHDAITGTAKQLVVFDYTRLLFEAVDKCLQVIDDAYRVLASNGNSVLPKQHYCKRLNISECHVTEKNSQFVVTIYNPLARKRVYALRFPVMGFDYIVKDSNDALIPTQLVPIPEHVLNLPERRSYATHELVFFVNLPPLGYTTYFVKQVQDIRKVKESKSFYDKIKNDGKDISISSDFYQVTIDGQTGLLKRLTNLESNLSDPVTQNFYYYSGIAMDNQRNQNRSSGSYIFRPNGADVEMISQNVHYRVVRGEIVNEVHQVFSNWVSQVIRVYKLIPAVEMEWVIGPIPVLDGIGKEIITLFNTSLESQKTFFTDSNGREMLKRILNQRPSYNLTLTEPVASNYYPIINQAYIKDMVTNRAQFSVITDRAVGGASLDDGKLEIMLHRRLLSDDGFGMFEALDEMGVDGKGVRVRGKTLILLNKPEEAMAYQRKHALKSTLRPLMMFVPTKLTPSEWKKQFKYHYSGLKRELPKNVHLLTLELASPSYLMLRFEHIYEINDDPENLSLPETIQLEDLFTIFAITSLEETMLAADRTKPVGNFKWKVKNDNGTTSTLGGFKAKEGPNSLAITLQPMEIRTFIAKVQYY